MGEGFFSVIFGGKRKVLSTSPWNGGLVTCTEAKSAAIQELCIASCYSRGLATGSGTDGTIVVSNRESLVRITEAGKHCKMGELIGKTVKQAVKEALYRQTGVNAAMQHNALRRLGRFGITISSLWEYAREQEDWKGIKEQEFAAVARRWAESREAVSGLWKKRQKRENI